jgi:hypothetical protein
VGYKERHNDMALNPWLDWHRYIVHSFGSATNVLQALFNSPHAFFEHVVWNLKLFPIIADYAVKPAYQLRSPVAGAIFGFLNFFYIYLSALVLALLIRLKQRTKNPSPFRHARLWWTVGISLFPTIVSALLIRPGPDHMAVLKAAALLPAAVLLQTILNRVAVLRNHPFFWVIISFVFLFHLTPTPFVPAKPRLIVPVVAHIPSIPGDEPYSLIADSAISYCNYTDPDRCKPIEILWNQAVQEMEMSTYIQQTNTRVIIVGARLLPELQPRWREAILQMIHSPKTHGWRVTGNTGAFLVLVRDYDISASRYFGSSCSNDTVWATP